MLDAMRRHSKSIVTKILFGLLILSFAAWGIGDMVRQAATPSGTAITVGEIHVSAAEVAQQVQRELDQLRAAGQPLDLEQAQRLGLVDSVIDTITTRAAYEAEALRLRLAVSDQMVVQEITSFEGFRGVTGQFDRGVFYQALRNARMDEAQYTQLVRDDLLLRQVLAPISDGVTAPQSLVMPLARYRLEKRRIEALTFSPASLSEPLTPPEPVLEAFYNEHQEAFIAPEYRKLTLVSVTPDDLAAEIQIDEDALKRAYDERQAEFTTPERRSLTQLVFDTQEAAQAAYDQLAAGAEMAAVGQPVSLSGLERSELPDELATPVFSAQAGKIIGPVSSPLGWHVIKIDDITPQQIKTLEQAKPVLIYDLSRGQAIDAIYALGIQIEDELAAGLTLEEIAAALKIRLTVFDAVDRRGQDPNGAQVGTALPFLGQALEAGFTNAEGVTSPLVDTQDSSYFIVRVDDITPPAALDYQRARPQVLASWLNEQRQQQAERLAEQALEQARSGQSLAAIAAQLGGTVSTPEPFDRGAANRRPLPGETLPAWPVVRTAFETTPGNIALAPASDSYSVVRVLEVIAADPTAADQTATKSVEQQLSRSFYGDLLQGFGESLRRSHDVKIDQAAIAAALR